MIASSHARPHVSKQLLRGDFQLAVPIFQSLRAIRRLQDKRTSSSKQPSRRRVSACLALLHLDFVYRQFLSEAAASTREAVYADELHAILQTSHRIGARLALTAAWHLVLLGFTTYTMTPATDVATTADTVTADVIAEVAQGLCLPHSLSCYPQKLTGNLGMKASGC